MSQFVANPTLATVTRVQDVLEAAEGPLTRYELHKRLGGSVNYPVLEAVLHFFSELKVVVDEGAGGKILWVHNTQAKARSLFAASKRVA
jgi:hypothetical protein